MNKIDFLKPLPIRGKIRVGNNADGGYVVYERLLYDVDLLMTYGVGWHIAFEEHFNKLTGRKVIMFDPTMVGKYFFSIKEFFGYLFSSGTKKAFEHVRMAWLMWRKKIELEKKKMFFVNEGIGVRKEGKYDSFAGHVERFGLQQKRIFLKIDIEGAEFDVFEDAAIYKYLQNVDQLVIEFHDMRIRFHQMERILRRLHDEFVLIHIHGNNCAPLVKIDLFNDGNNTVTMPDVFELSLVRRSLIPAEDLSDQEECYPVADLDYPNDPRIKDHDMQFI